MYKFISYSCIIVLYHTTKKVTKKLLYRSDGILQAVARLRSNHAQISSHHHICGGDSDVLTWGVAAPQTMVEADAAPLLWWHDENQNNFCARVT